MELQGPSSPPQRYLFTPFPRPAPSRTFSSSFLLLPPPPPLRRHPFSLVARSVVYSVGFPSLPLQRRPFFVCVCAGKERDCEPEALRCSYSHSSGLVGAEIVSRFFLGSWFLDSFPATTEPPRCSEPVPSPRRDVTLAARAQFQPANPTSSVQRDLRQQQTPPSRAPSPRFGCLAGLGRPSSPTYSTTRVAFSHDATCCSTSLAIRSSLGCASSVTARSAPARRANWWCLSELSLPPPCMRAGQGGSRHLDPSPHHGCFCAVPVADMAG